jgi:hypothetical protein
MRPNIVQQLCDEAQARLRYYAEATPTGPGGTYRLRRHSLLSVADDDA